MIRSIVLPVLFLSLLPLPLSAQDNGENSSDNAAQVQSMIDDRVFMQNGGVEKMQGISSDLTVEWKEKLYKDNSKSPAWTWMNLLVPSLGNWIVGDRTGALITDFGVAGGYIILYAGDIVVAYSTAGYYIGNNMSFSDYHKDTVTGFILMLAGSVIMAGFEIYSCASVISYTDNYDGNLKAGLGISYIDTDEIMQRMSALSTQKPLIDLFHIDLLSCRF